MSEFIHVHGLDLFTTLLGLLYIWLEYRANIYLWLIGIVMPALDVWLYWSHGLYGDAGMAAYYTVAAAYGYVAWKWGRQKKDSAELPITSMRRNLYLPTAVFLLVAWSATYYVLSQWTNSTVPLLDSFTNALSIVAMWALARKFVEQWLCWIIVDAVCCYLYVAKDIPFKAMLYGLYVVIAVMGYFRWKRLSVTA